MMYFCLEKECPQLPCYVRHKKRVLIPFTATIPAIGIHSLEPSGKMVGLLRFGRASKWAWTNDAIRDDNCVADAGQDIGMRQ